MGNYLVANRGNYDDYANCLGRYYPINRKWVIYNRMGGDYRGVTSTQSAAMAAGISAISTNTAISVDQLSFHLIRFSVYFFLGMVSSVMGSIDWSGFCSWIYGITQ